MWYDGAQIVVKHPVCFSASGAVIVVDISTADWWKNIRKMIESGNINFDKT